MTLPETGCVNDAIDFHASVRVRAVDATVFELRMFDPSPAIVASLTATFGLHWPVTPNTQAGDLVRVLCLGPREWLIVGGDARSIEARLGVGCGDAPHHVVNVSDGRRCFEVAGQRAADLMGSGCGLDLQCAGFGLNTCARTLLAQVTVVLFRVGDGESERWEVIADCSVAEYLAGWFAEAARAL